MVTRPHLVGQPVDLSPGVDKNDTLGDGKGFVEVAEGLELPLFLLNIDIELFDTLEGELITLDENTDRLVHELASDLKGLWGHGGREDSNLDLGREKLEDIVDLRKNQTTLLSYSESSYATSFVTLHFLLHKAGLNTQ